MTSRIGEFEESKDSFLSSIGSNLWKRAIEVGSLLRPADVLVLILILGFGVLQFIFSVRAHDFANDDVFYADAARSLADHGFYGINGYPETNQPPGLAAILALLSMTGDFSRATCSRMMTVLGTLGFVASYWVLRRQLPRLVAAAICLLLISSPIYFRMVSQWLSAAYPYFFTAMGALLVARRLDGATGLKARIASAALLTILITAAMLFASAGIAFLGAIVASVGVTLFRNRRLGLSRLKVYLVVLLLGAAAEGFWMHRSGGEASAGISALEWPIEGFPRSYLSQLKVKEGNYPELGMASPRDVVVRVLRNASAQADLVSKSLFRVSAVVTSASILVLIPLILIVLGWCSSVWRTGGGIQEWYFAGYEFVYLLWPWNPAQGWVFLPVLPLACLYMWRGGETVALWARTKPRIVGAVWLPIAAFLSILAWLWVHGSGIVGPWENSGVQDETSFVIWMLSAVVAGWMVLAGAAWLKQASLLFGYCCRPIGALRACSARGIIQFLGLAAVAILVVMGLGTQFKIARANLDLSSRVNRLSADAVAGVWIRSHTEPDAVIMARHVPIVYHYAKRKIIWFPPSSDAQLLMDGINRHEVAFAIVVHRKESYYLPPDDVSFAPLIRAYPDVFQLIYQTREFRIFRVSPKGSEHRRTTSISFDHSQIQGRWRHRLC
jgi:hypothetical protein